MNFPILRQEKSLKTLKPQNGLAYNNRGTAYPWLNKNELAIVDYTRAINLNPKFSLSYRSRGIAYYKLKQFQRAIEDFDKAIAIDPKYAGAHCSLA